MLAFARLRFGLVIAAFAAAYLCQPLALDACAVSCEAARAARTPALAAPCHHTTSCATQVSQPASPGFTASAPAPAPPAAVIDVRPALVASSVVSPPFVRPLDSSPPINATLRL